MRKLKALDYENRLGPGMEIYDHCCCSLSEFIVGPHGEYIQLKCGNSWMPVQARPGILAVRLLCGAMAAGQG